MTYPLQWATKDNCAQKNTTKKTTKKLKLTERLALKDFGSTLCNNWTRGRRKGDEPGGLKFWKKCYYHLIKDDDDETVMNRGLEVLKKKINIIIIWSKFMMNKEILMEKWWTRAVKFWKMYVLNSFFCLCLLFIAAFLAIMTRVSSYLCAALSDSVIPIWICKLSSCLFQHWSKRYRLLT